MNGPFHQAPAGPLPSLPAEFESLAPPPLLLPGESLERYHLMRQAILIELAPRSAIEWLLAIDVVELSWEIQRHRLFRQKLLESYRQRAIERTLTQIDTVGIAHSQPNRRRARPAGQVWGTAEPWPWMTSMPSAPPCGICPPP